MMMIMMMWGRRLGLNKVQDGLFTLRSLLRVLITLPLPLSLLFSRYPWSLRSR